MRLAKTLLIPFVVGAHVALTRGQDVDLTCDTPGGKVHITRKCDDANVGVSAGTSSARVRHDRSEAAYVGSVKVTPTSGTWGDIDDCSDLSGEGV